MVAVDDSVYGKVAMIALASDQDIYNNIRKDDEVQALERVANNAYTLVRFIIICFHF